MTQHTRISPAQLNYLHNSLSSLAPIRADGRSSTHFRPLMVETDILPSANGSARVFFGDGSEAVAGVKLELHKMDIYDDSFDDVAKQGDNVVNGSAVIPGQGLLSSKYLQLTVGQSGTREDEAPGTHLSNILREAILADTSVLEKLRLNSRFYWKLYLDIMPISDTGLYSIPLLSTTAHLALLSTRCPGLLVNQTQDLRFDDDWSHSRPLFPHLLDVESSLERAKASCQSTPPIALLVAAVGGNVFFDPTHEELAVAEAILNVSVVQRPRAKAGKWKHNHVVDLTGLRFVDAPSRATPSGVPNHVNPATNGEVAGNPAQQRQSFSLDIAPTHGVWQAPRGGIKRGIVNAVLDKVLVEGGMANEILTCIAEAVHPS